MPPVKAPIFFPFLTPAAGLHWDCPPPHPRPHPCPLQAILLSAAEAGFNAEVRSCNSPVFNAPVTSHNSQEEGHILHVGDPALPELGRQQATDPLTTSSIPTSQISSCNHRNSACPGGPVNSSVRAQVKPSQAPRWAGTPPTLPLPCFPPPSPLAQCMTRVMRLLYSVSSKHTTHIFLASSLLSELNVGLQRPDSELWTCFRTFSAPYYSDFLSKPAPWSLWSDSAR